MSATFLLVRFLSLKESTYNTNRNVFYFISSFFLILKQSTYETKKYVFYCTLKALFILEIIKFWNVQIFKCQRHQMLKHETQTFYWIIWEVNTVITKEKILSKNSMKNMAWKESSIKRNLRRLAWCFEQILIVLLLHI